MTKRKHEETEGGVSLENVKVDREKGEGYSRREMQGQGDKPHTIDSDDEDDERVREKTFEKMKDDDIEGQEDDTLNFDGDIKITPFNLKEEQQEGTFSKDGNFVWNDKKEDIKDAWLDEIDWVKVKQRSAEEVARKEREDEDEDEAQFKYSEAATYRDILSILKPGETVAKALRRLGGNKKTMSASERWKRKKAGMAEDPEEAKNKELMLKLTGLADTILTRSGAMEIYEETYESINFKLKQSDEKKHGKKTEIPEDVDDDDALDMFADSLDDKPAKDKENAGAGSSSANGSEATAKGPEKKDEDTKSDKPVALGLDDEVMWEYKWKNEEGEEIHGPHTSQQMLDWQESGHFMSGVWCRKVGSTDFSSSKRIDFDLYT